MGMRNPTMEGENPTEERGTLILAVDALVNEGYKKSAACAKLGIQPYQYYRWRDRRKKKAARSEAAVVHLPDKPSEGYPTDGSLEDAC